jgi:hypothetical protein
MMRQWPILLVVAVAAWSGGAPNFARPGIAAPVSAEPSAVPTAKRVAPPKVAPVQIAGVRIEAIHWGRSRGLDQNGGYIAGVDTRTGRELWLLKVYDTAYDPRMEQDVQDVFIAKLTRDRGDRLSVVDERGRRYLVDMKTRIVTPR